MGYRERVGGGIETGRSQPLSYKHKPLDYAMPPNIPGLIYRENTSAPSFRRTPESGSRYAKLRKSDRAYFGYSRWMTEKNHSNAWVRPEHNVHVCLL
jgi:hypothetical protein